MCWTSSTGSGKSAGRAPSSLAKAGGPPVEAATARTLGACVAGIGAVLASSRPGSVRARRSAPIGRRRITGTWLMMRSWVQIWSAIAS